MNLSEEINNILRISGTKQLLEDNKHPTPLNDKFWKWFGNSKMVDKNGYPITFYHGSLWDFKNFGTKNDINFSFSWQFAYNYASRKSFENGLDLEPRVYECYLKVEKPFDFRSDEDLNDLKKLIGNKKIEIFRDEVTFDEFKNKLQGFYYENSMTQEEFDNVTTNDKWDEPNHKVNGPIAWKEIIGKTNDYIVIIQDIETPRKDYFSDYPADIIDTDKVYNELKNNPSKYIKFNGIETEVNIETTAKPVNRYDGTIPKEYPYKTKVYLKKIYRPLEQNKKYDADNWFSIESSYIGGTKFIEFLIKNGYDGYYKQENGVLNISVPNPNQIKSIYNNGNWDESSNIFEDY